MPSRRLAALLFGLCLLSCAVRAAEPPVDPALPTIWIAGDSTAAAGGPDATGWGVPFPALFDPARVNVINRARGGRSSRTFITDGSWEKLAGSVKRGDLVVIQFGHNDSGALNDDTRARGSIRSLGEETETIDNRLTKKTEVVHTYGWYLRKMIADVKAKGAQPIVFSITVRNEWHDGRVERRNGPWSELAATLARDAGVPFVDHTTLIADEYERLGAEKVKTFFPRDHTHTGPAGAELNATLALTGLLRQRTWPVDALLSAKGRAVQAAVAAAPAFVASPQLQALAERAAQGACERFRGLLPAQLALTLIDLRDPQQPRRASVRGDAPIYPASVIKLFYLAAAHRWLEDGRLADTPELRRALRDMIVDSSNDATGYVVDLLTGTTSGPELPDDEIAAWFEKRSVVTRYFASLGYAGINASKKPWGDGPYGRETQAVRLFEPKRNALTTDATARLLTEIVTARCVTPERSREMMTLLSRDPAAKSDDPDNQSKFTGPALPPGAKLWSKAGWTSQTRHDAAYVELPNGAKFILVVFTTEHANDREIIATVAKTVVEGIGAVGAP